MVDVDDPTNLGGKLARQWEKLDAAAIDDRDREAIRAFVEYRRDIEDRARSTRSSDLSQLRCASQWAACPLVEMSFGDVRRFLSMLVRPSEDGGRGLDPDGTGIYGYERALRVFFRFLHESDEWGAYGFHDEIELTDLEMSGAGERDEMLTGVEIERLKDAANHSRDRALISLLGDIGGRITMVLSLRVGDLHLDGDEPYFTPRTKDLPDGLKDLDSARIPILHSRADLRTYLRKHHPDKTNQDAPAFAVLKGYDHEHPEQGALSGDRAADVIQECADRAGIDKPVNPHNFRRTAATRMSNSDRLTPQEIIQIMGWSDDRPLQAYDLTTEHERNSAIHAALGFVDEASADGDDDLALEARPCGNCARDIPADATFCPGCGEPQTAEARAMATEATDATATDAIGEADLDRRELKGMIREAIKEDPGLLDG